MLDANQENFNQLEGIKKGLSNQSHLIQLINMDPDMHPDEKRQLIDGIYLMMIETAKQGNQLTKEIKKSLGEEKDGR
jgi:hypothetical protein